MSAVASVNPGLADLLQTLSSLNSPVLSSSRVTSALEKAPAADIVQLSIAATQLEGVDAMFGISNGSNAGANSGLANLGNLLTGSNGAAANTQLLSDASSNAASADQLATSQATAQAAETQALLYGTGGTSSPSGTLFNLLG
jgi:phage tail protein X